MVADFRRSRIINVCAVLASKIAGDMICRECSNRPDLRIGSVHTSVESAVEELQRHPYNVVFANLHLGIERYAGVRLLTHLKQFKPEVRGIVIADSDDHKDIVPCFRAGARGYLLEGSLDTETLCKAIGCVNDGQIWANAAQISCILEDFVAPGNAALTPPISSILTKREIEVVDLMLRGKTNKEIGTLLQLSEHTVKNHIVKVFAKLGVTSRAGAIFELYKRFPMVSVRGLSLNSEPRELHAAS